MEPTQSDDEIWYTSTDGNIVTPPSYATTPFLDTDGNNIQIISNIYENGKGIIKLEKDCYQIGQNAFMSCKTLSSIIIPNLVTFIRKQAFSSCTSLTGVAIPNTVTGFATYVFSECSSLTGITIPDSVTAIYDYTFHNCSSLAEIIIPNKVTLIGKDSFYGCKSLRQLPLN